MTSSIQGTRYGFQVQVFTNTSMLPDSVKKSLEETREQMKNSAILIDLLAISKSHFLESQKSISEASDGLKGTALFIGAGPCRDFSLQEMAKFDRIYLVDIDVELTKVALASLPIQLQSKFVIQQADITGYFAEFTTKAEEIVNTASKDQFWDKISEMVKTLEFDPFEFPPQGASFVVSSMVLSQLSHTFINHLVQLYKTKYGEQKFPYGTLDEFMEGIELHHLSQIKTYLNPQGKAYISYETSIQKATHILYEQKIIKTTNADYFDISHKSTLKDAIEVGFNVLKKQEWDWPVLSSLEFEEPSTNIKFNGVDHHVEVYHLKSHF